MITLPTVAEAEAAFDAFRLHVPSMPPGEFDALEGVSAVVKSDGARVLLMLGDAHGSVLPVMMSPAAALLTAQAISRQLETHGFTDGGELLVSDPENARSPSDRPLS